MSSYNTVSSFFDKSGDTDQAVVCFGGVSSYNEDFGPFAEEWARLLYRNGIQVLSAKTAFNIERPLSKKNQRIGLERRIDDLRGFIECIRKHLLVITGISIDVAAFKKLPQHFFHNFGNNPEFVGFARSLLKVLEFTPDNDKITFIVDDDERTGVHIFRLWRKIKRIYPGSRERLAAISFADDRFLFALQAADLVAGLMRLEAGKRFLQQDYNLAPLYTVLEAPIQQSERLWELQTAFADEPLLRDLSKLMEEERNRQLEAQKERS